GRARGPPRARSRRAARPRAAAGRAPRAPRSSATRPARRGAPSRPGSRRPPLQVDGPVAVDALGDGAASGAVGAHALEPVPERAGEGLHHGLADRLQRRRRLAGALRHRGARRRDAGAPQEPGRPQLVLRRQQRVDAIHEERTRPLERAVDLELDVAVPAAAEPARERARVEEPPAVPVFLGPGGDDAEPDLVGCTLRQGPAPLPRHRRSAPYAGHARSAAQGSDDPGAFLLPARGWRGYRAGGARWRKALRTDPRERVLHGLDDPLGA